MDQDDIDWGAALEVVRLEDAERGAADFVTGGGCTYRVTRAVMPLSEEHARIEALWRALPLAEQMRCHLPKYGLRATRDEQVVMRASLCFRCNNIFFWTESGFHHREFDAQSAEAEALLALIKGSFASRVAE